MHQPRRLQARWPLRRDARWRRAAGWLMPQANISPSRPHDVGRGAPPGPARLAIGYLAGDDIAFPFTMALYFALGALGGLWIPCP